MDVKGVDIEIPYGDADAFTIDFEDDVPADGTQVLVTLKEDIDPDTEPVWTKTLEVVNGCLTVPLTTEDTTIKPGTYFWGLKLLDRPTSPVPVAAFTVKAVIP